MTLADWCKENDVKHTHPTTEKGAVSLIVEINHPKRADLYHLTDYVVSSVFGIVYWLVTRKPPRPLCPECGQMV